MTDPLKVQAYQLRFKRPSDGEWEEHQCYDPDVPIEVLVWPHPDHAHPDHDGIESIWLNAMNLVRPSEELLRDIGSIVRKMVLAQDGGYPKTVVIEVRAS